MQTFRTIAERNRYRIHVRYVLSMASGGTSADMKDDEIDQEWPVTDSTVHLSLPPETALSLSGAKAQWTSTSGKRSRAILTTSSVKASRINGQDTVLDHVSFHLTDDNNSNKATGLDEHGLPLGDWEDC